jgi:hypothetical protein
VLRKPFKYEELVAILTRLKLAPVDSAVSIYSMKARSLGGRRRVRFLPMTSTATPVSAAAKQQQQNNHNKDQFHRKSPLMVMTSNRELPPGN